MLGVLSPSLVLLLLLDQPAASGDAVADRVFGQGGSFASNTINFGGVSASSLYQPAGIFDAAGNLYVADESNNRVLEFDNPLVTDTVADRVFGQAGSFTTNTCDTGGTSASSLCGPNGLALDVAGNLYVADGEDHRVLEYNAPLTDTVADRVFGQGGSFTTKKCNMGGPASASTLCVPAAVALDSAGNLYVADSYNARVLEYNTPLTMDTVADRVFGQGGSFTGDTCDYGGTSASSLCRPGAVTVDADGNVYIGDSFRLLEYDKPLTTDTVADRVFGEAGSFTLNLCNLGGITASSLCEANGLASDSAGNLYVTDSGNSRLLEYDSPLTTDTVADRVVGQGGSFTTGTCNMGGISASSLCGPIGVTLDPAGKLYVADTFNNRVLHYDSLQATPAPTTPAATLAPTPVATPVGTPAPVGGIVDVLSGGSSSREDYLGWALSTATAVIAIAGGAYAWRRARRASRGIARPR